MYSRGIEKVRKPSVYAGFRTFNIYSSSITPKWLVPHYADSFVLISSFLNCFLSVISFFPHFCCQFVIKSLFKGSEMADLSHSSLYFHYSSSSIEKGLEVHRSYISVWDSSLLNCSFLIHEFTDDLNVILLSRVTISLCRGLSSIASDFANGLRLCVKKISSI